MPGYESERERNKVRGSLQRLAHLLDTAIPLPGGGRIGLDGIIGLIPGAGDLIGTLLSSYIVAQAYRIGASRTVLIRMAGNIALESLLGTIPLLGDLFDFVWKANRRNVDLLERQLAEPGRTQRQSILLVASVVLGLLILISGLTYATVAFVHWIWVSLEG